MTSKHSWMVARVVSSTLLAAMLPPGGTRPDRQNPGC